MNKELIRKALEKLANDTGEWDGERNSISASYVNDQARKALASLDEPEPHSKSEFCIMEIRRGEK